MSLPGPGRKARAAKAEASPIPCRCWPCARRGPPRQQPSSSARRPTCPPSAPRPRRLPPIPPLARPAWQQTPPRPLPAAPCRPAWRWPGCRCPCPWTSASRLLAGPPSRPPQSCRPSCSAPAPPCAPAQPRRRRAAPRRRPTRAGGASCPCSTSGCRCAARCGSQQHMAAACAWPAGLHCTALHHTALHCTTLRCAALHCVRLQRANSRAPWTCLQDLLSAVEHRHVLAATTSAGQQEQLLLAGAPGARSCSLQAMLVVPSRPGAAIKLVASVTSPRLLLLRRFAQVGGSPPRPAPDPPWAYAGAAAIHLA